MIRSNSAPLNSGSMAYFPEVKKELAATPEKERKLEIIRMYLAKEKPETEKSYKKLTQKDGEGVKW